MLDELLNDGTINLDIGIDGYQFSSYLNLESDINDAISKTDDPEKQKTLKKAKLSL